MLGVVPPRQLLVHLHNADGRQLEPPPFQTGYHRPNQPALHAVRFDCHESPFHRKLPSPLIECRH